MTRARGAITQVATIDTQDDLVHLARAITAAQLETVARAYSRARPGITDPDRAPAFRRTLTCYGDDGSLVGTFRLAPENGAVLVTALSAARERRPAQDSGAVGDDVGDPTLDPAEPTVEIAEDRFGHVLDVGRRTRRINRALRRALARCDGG